jgi:hypothetical protein
MCHVYGLLHTQYRAAHEKVQFTFCQYFMLEALSRDAAPVIQSAGLHTSSTHIVELVQKYTGNRTVNSALRGTGDSLYRRKVLRYSRKYDFIYTQKKNTDLHTPTFMKIINVQQF